MRRGRGGGSRLTDEIEPVERPGRDLRTTGCRQQRRRTTMRPRSSALPIVAEGVARRRGETARTNPVPRRWPSPSSAWVGGEDDSSIRRDIYSWDYSFISRNPSRGEVERMQPPQPYPGAYGPARPVESYLAKRMVFALNAVGVFGWWLGGVLAAFSRDANVLNLARFLVVSGGAMAAFFSLGGALGSKRTTDMQNIGLLVWAGLVLTATVALLTFMGRP